MDKKRKREETERARYEETEEREMGGREGRKKRETERERNFFKSYGNFTYKQASFSPSSLRRKETLTF